MIPDRVHLVGSIALDTVEEVFQTVGAILGRRLRRVPDGEPGGRRLWISWQYPLLRAQPFLAPDFDTQSPRVRGTMTPLMLTGNVQEEDVHFGELGYAREARISYQDFLTARQLGHLPSDVRFQVALPTPFAVVHPFLAPRDALRVEAPYEQAMLREVDTISHAIPHSDLCIQWDVCVEMLMWDARWEGFRNPFGSGMQVEVMSRMARLSAAIPRDVELGFHLCYGDYDAKHFIEPLDSTKLVEMANALAGTVTRPISYIHMPVPIDRSDDDYFRPLAGLRLDPSTELYLGLVHEDGLEGVNQRIAAACKYAPRFGIATECGMARKRTPAQVRKLLEIHAAASREPSALAGSA